MPKKRPGDLYKNVSTKEQPVVELNPMIEALEKVEEEAACYICPSGDEWQTRTIQLTGNDTDGGTLKIKDIEGKEMTYEVLQVFYNAELKPDTGLQISYDAAMHTFKASSPEVGETMKKMAFDYNNKTYGAIDRGPAATNNGHVERTKVNLTAEEEEAFQGIMWCGTIFAWDEDGDGDIDMTKSDEYLAMSEVADGIDEAAEGSEDGAGKLAKRVLKAHIFSPEKTNWAKLQKEEDLTFALQKQQVRIVVKYAPSVNLVIFSLAGLLTQISVMSDFHNALLNNGVLKQLATQFKNNEKKGKGLNILEKANEQQKANYDTQVAQEITKQNAINYGMLLKAKQSDENMATIRTQIMQNMETISERRVKIKRDLNLSKEVETSLNMLNTKATKVAEIAWWLKMRCWFIGGFIAFLILTAVILFLYFYLKK